MNIFKKNKLFNYQHNHINNRINNLKYNIIMLYKIHKKEQSEINNMDNKINLLNNNIDNKINLLNNNISELYKLNQIEKDNLIEINSYLTNELKIINHKQEILIKKIKVLESLTENILKIN